MQPGHQGQKYNDMNILVTDDKNLKQNKVNVNPGKKILEIHLEINLMSKIYK